MGNPGEMSKNPCAEGFSLMVEHAGCRERFVGDTRAKLPSKVRIGVLRVHVVLGNLCRTSS
jgi:hypothetical protein